MLWRAAAVFAAEAEAVPVRNSNAKVFQDNGKEGALAMPEGTENQQEEMLTLAGVVEHIIYANEENGYVVCEMYAGEDEYITVVGSMPYLTAGESVRVTGSWTTHPSFGRQFRAVCYEKQLPETKDAIMRYLSSRSVRGIGPKTARLIVEQFGEDTFDVIEHHPEWLAQLPGISMKKAAAISESFKEQFGIRSVMLFCQDYFTPGTAVRIYHKYGSAAVDVIRENPYVLCGEIYGVGFEKADKIARSLGMDRNAKERIGAAIVYVCQYNAQQNGHVCLPEDKLIPGVVRMLKVEEHEVEDALAELYTQQRAVRLTVGGRPMVYLTVYYRAERFVCQKLDLLCRNCSAWEARDVEAMIDKIETEEGLTYARLQKKAIRAAMENGVMVLTGGPGTGKTTVVRAILRIFESMGLEIALAAPTGRAAKRLSSATQREAKTLHRLLEMEFTEDIEPRFRRNENHLLDEDVIVVDEMSMVDLLLFSSLLKALRPAARLVVIGDADQLPSVGAGNVLQDLIESDRFSTIRLTEIFRQAKESLIVTNAHRINAGQYPELREKARDFFFLEREDEELTARTVADLYKNRLPRTYGEEMLKKIQVITPSRKGAAGTEPLNVLLQSLLNPPAENKSEKRLRGIVFREGDKVMQIKNNYDIEWERETLAGKQSGVGIFNGDIGRILSIDNENSVMWVDFDDRIVQYDFALLDELEHAYAITVHKSQGSEYPVVILPVYRYSAKLMTRNLLYTAVTRAESMVVLVGSEKEVQNMVDNNRRTKRYTGLHYFLNQYEETDGCAG